MVLIPRSRQLVSVCFLLNFGWGHADLENYYEPVKLFFLVRKMIATLYRKSVLVSSFN